MPNPKKDRLRSARASGYYPLSFNFMFNRHERVVQCSYCGQFVPEKKMTRDHVYPKSLGGIIKTPACLDCNMRKEDKKPIEWALFSSATGLALGELESSNGRMPLFQSGSESSNLFSSTNLGFLGAVVR